MYRKDDITNISTALMAIKDIATYEDIPINMHFDKFWIHIIVGFGTPYQRKQSFYTQDCYKLFSRTDSICDWIEKAVNEIKELKGE